MPKGLTRNDLLYILNEIFKISTANNNALSFSEQGLFVESYKVHSENGDLHVPSKEVHDIIAGFSLDANDNLVYNGDPASIRISDDEDNAIELDADGALYVRKVYDQSDFQEHLDDDERHVTQEDRDKWDGAVDEANEYTDDEIDKIKIHNVVYVTSVPDIDGMDEHTMYILLDQANIVENPVIKIKVLNEVVTIGITKATMNLYYTKEEINTKFEEVDNKFDNYVSSTDAEETYQHKFENEQALSLIKDDGTGHPVFGNRKSLSERANNGLSYDDNGGLFYPDLSSELHSLQISASFAKTNLYDQEINSTGTYTLKDAISNYNLLLVEYWFYPPSLIQVPVYTEKLVMHTAEEYEGYSFVFGTNRMEDWFDKLDYEHQEYDSEKVNPWISYYNYDSKKRFFEITNLSPTKNDNTTLYNENKKAYIYSKDEYLEYKCRFNFAADYYAHDGGSPYPESARTEFVLSYIKDDENVIHKLSLVELKGGASSGNWVISDPYKSDTFSYFDNGGIAIAVDPIYNGRRIECSRFYAIHSQGPGWGNFLCGKTVYIIKTSSSVKLWISGTESDWLDFNVPTSTPILNFNLNEYGETLFFKDKPGKIGYGVRGYLYNYKRIYNHMFEQHIYYESLDTVVDRIETIENPEHSIGYAKTALMDTDNMEFLYNRSIGYTLELGYGISNANIKLRMHDNKLYVDHLTNTAIYRITGIGKGQSQEVEPTPDVVIGDDEVDDDIDGNIDDDI